MVSIEKRQELQARFDFNRPFGCVRMEYGDSAAVLPSLKWDRRSIVWLDYDGGISSSVLQDVAFVASVAVSGSVLVVTVNAEGYGSDPRQPWEATEKALRRKFGKQIRPRVPPAWMNGKDVQGPAMARTLHRLVTDEIMAALRDRNGVTSFDEVMHFQQLFNFVYRDTARMLTVGGVLFEEADKELLAACEFGSLAFVSSGNDEYQISVPIVTPRERHYLNQLLPEGSSAESSQKALAIGLSADEIENYVRLYRFCPSYAEIEL